MHLQLYAREAIGAEIIELARQLRRSWVETPEAMRNRLFNSLHPANVMLHQDMEKLCAAILRFDTAP